MYLFVEVHCPVLSVYGGLKIKFYDLKLCLEVLYLSQCNKVWFIPCPSSVRYE